MLLEPGAELELNIEKTVYRGNGLARVERCVIFVPGVLPGEVVRARIVRKRKNYAEAELLEVLEGSRSRITPRCPLAYSAEAALYCPGCVYQHAGYEYEVGIKQEQFVDQLQRHAGVDQLDSLPPVASPIDYGYRNRITLHAAGGKVGYRGVDNVTIVPVQSCPLAMPPLNFLLQSVLSDPVRPEEGRLTLRTTEPDGCFFWWEPPGDQEPWLLETSRLGLINLPPSSFSQVNAPVTDLLLGDVMRVMEKLPVDGCLDLYCGVGLFALAAYQCNIRHVVGVDNDPTAVKAAELNAEERDFEGIRFLNMPAATGLRVMEEFEADRTLVVVDPPRRGLDGKTLDGLMRYQPRYLCCISCAVDTLARDLKPLMAAGYRPVSMRMFDMFPRTPYFESMVLLEATD